MKRSAICLCFLFLSCRLYSQNTYYVDQMRGKDRNSGLFVAAPWKTISKANSELKPGDKVCLRAGTYSETIAPLRSGTSLEPITYQRYASEDVVINKVSNGILLKNKKHIIIEGLSIADVGRFVVISNASQHNVIRNCRMERAIRWGGVRIENSSFNKIIDNYISNGHGDLVELFPNADFNLIKGNEIFGGPLNTHSCLLIRSMEAQDYSSYNIVLNNYIHGGCDDNVNVLQRVNHNLFEGNTFEAVTGGAGLKFCGGQHNIFRKNVIVDCKAYGVGIYTMLSDSYQSYGEDNVFYHNVALRSDRGKDIDAGIRFLVYRDGGEIKNNMVKNNIFMSNVPQQIFVGAIEGFEDRLKNNIFITNIIFSNNLGYKVISYKGIRYSLQKIESIRESGFMRNAEADPRFLDTGKKDFHLRSDSPAIDKGSFLTRTTSAAEGTQIRVEDARYFCDGFGIIEGDLIQLEGQTKVVRIMNVDYKNNIITVDTPLIWTSGQGVSLPYSGSAPDIGAFEFDSPSPLKIR